MNKSEAKAILDNVLREYRSKSYLELLAMRNDPTCVEKFSPSGVAYQVEVDICFDDASKQTLLVMAAIDDGGWSAFSPMCDDFIIRPDGSFVGE